MRVAVMAAVWLLCVTSAEAQIRIVPRERLDSVANPATVGKGQMLFSEGRTANVDIPIVEIEWTNRGNEPLVVTRVTTGCNCVRVEHSVQPVRVGAKGWIKVTFDPKGRVGGVVQRVWIYTNLSAKTPTAVLELHGRVLSSKTNDDYPKAMGDLRLSAESVTIVEGRASLACKNAGGRALRIAADVMLSSPGVVLRTEPAVLPPGAEGVLIVEYKSRTTEEVRLYVGGLELPPRMRKLEVVSVK